MISTRYNDPMYFPKVLKPRPILFDLGDTLINFSATNPLPYLRRGTTLAYDYLRENTNGALCSFQAYFENCRRYTYTAYLLSELCRREADLLDALRRVHHLLRLPQDRTFLLRVAERFYIPMKELGTAEEDIHEVLDGFVERGHPMAIVSNTMVPGEVLDNHLREVNLIKYFDVRIYSCDIGRKKPHRKMFHAALEGLNVKPQDTVFVGDKPHLDVRGAARLGMTTVLKKRKGTESSRLYKPDFVVRRLTELPAILDEVGLEYYDHAV